MVDDATIRIGAAVQGAVKGLGGVGGAAKKMGKAVAATAVAAGLAGAAILALTNSVTKNVDKMGKLSTSLGVNIEFLSGLQLAAELGGTNIETMGSALAKLTKNANDATKNIGVAKDTFKELGIEVKDSEGNLREAGDLLPEIADKFKAMGAGAKTTAAAMEIFGKSGAKLIPTLLEGSEGFRKAADEARRFGLIIDEEAKEKAAEFQDTLLRVRSVGAGFIRQIGLGMAPVLTEVGKAFLNSGINAQDFGIGVTKFAAAAIVVATESFQDFLKVGAKVITFASFFSFDIFGDTAESMQAFAKQIEDMADSPKIEKFKETLAQLAASAGKLGKETPNAGKGLAAAVAAGSDFGDTLETTVTTSAVGGIKKASKDIGDTFAKSFTSAMARGDARKAMFEILSATLTETINDAGVFIAEVALGLADKTDGIVADILMTVGEALGTMTGPIGGLVASVIELALSLVGDKRFLVGFIASLGDIIEGIIANVIPGVILALPTIIPEVVTAVLRGVATLLMTLFSASFWIEAADNFVKGFRETFGAKGFITEMWDAGELEEVGRSIGQGIIDLLKNFKIKVDMPGGGGGGGGGTGGQVVAVVTEPVRQVAAAIGMRRAAGAPVAATATGGVLQINVSSGDGIMRMIAQQFTDAINRGNPEMISFSRAVVAVG